MSKRLDWDKADRIYPDPARTQPEEPLIAAEHHSSSAAEISISAYFSRAKEAAPNLDARGQLEHRIAQHEQYLRGLKAGGTSGRRIRREVTERLSELERQLAQFEKS